MLSKDIIIPLADSGESQLVEVMLELSTAFYVSNGYIYFDVNPNVTKTGNTDKFISNHNHVLMPKYELF